MMEDRTIYPHIYRNKISKERRYVREIPGELIERKGWK